LERFLFLFSIPALRMPYTAQIETEAEWNCIMQYLKTNVVPDSVTKSNRSNFKRRCSQFVLKADPECPDKDTLFLKQNCNDENDPDACQLRLFIPTFQKERRARIIAEFHADKTGHGDYHKTYAQITEMHAGKDFLCTASDYIMKLKYSCAFYLRDKPRRSGGIYPILSQLRSLKSQYQGRERFYPCYKP